MKDGGPAFPFEYDGPNMWGDGTERHLHSGMSLRDYFAAQALAGFLGHPEDTGKSDIAAKYAYEIADAMLAQREK